MTSIQSENWQHIVTQLAAIAQKKGISSYKLAELSGIRQPNISRLFSLRYSPTLKVLQRVAAALEVEIVLAEK